MLKMMLVLAATVCVAVSCQSKNAPQPTEGAADGWVSLFDGKTLNGWKANESPETFKVRDGAIVASGPRAHLFYVGDLRTAKFKSFELKVDVKAGAGANSGVYFHTAWQDAGWLEQGLEVQINNTQPEHDGYYEFKKTGSLYGVRNIFKQLMKDEEWFTMHIIVEGARVRVKLNDLLVVDYTEPEGLNRGDSGRRRNLGSGTFALQGHDPASRVMFRNIMVRPIDVVFGVPASPGGEKYPLVKALSTESFPIIDFHSHLKGGLTIEQLLAHSRATGISYGVAPNCGLNFPITDDAGIEQFIQGMKGLPVWLGMQAEGREWVHMFSPEAVAKFDYVFSDAMTFTDDNGKRMRIWIKDELGEIGDKQQWMDMYVDRIVKVISDEPIDIYANATILPAPLAKEYDQLWTTERMMNVIDAAVAHGVAIEIGAANRIPSERFIKLAKEKGAKFSLGTNNAGNELGSLEYALRMVQACGLTGKDMFMPKPDGQKPIQVKGFKK